MSHTTTRRAAALGLALTTALALTACGSEASTESGSASSATTPATSSASPATSLTLADAWAKALDPLPAEHPMTGAFGTLTNPTDQAITVTGGSTPVAKMVELHETVKNASGQMQMQPKPGGFVIPAKGSLELKPGGNHIMVMGVTEPLKNGSTLTLTLTTSAGKVTLDIPVRTFPGAQESYAPGSTSPSMSPSMSHS